MPLQIWSFSISSACMGTSIYRVTPGEHCAFSFSPKWKFYLPKKKKWVCEPPLHIQSGWQVSVPAAYFCALAGEELCPQLCLHLSSLFPQPIFSLLSWSWPLKQIYVLHPTQHKGSTVFGRLWIFCLVLCSSQSHSLPVRAFGSISTDVSFPGATGKASTYRVPLGILIFSPSSVTFTVISNH